MFKHKLGIEIESRVSKLRGIVTARSEHLYGCNRYLVNPQVGADGKIPDSWWVDEDDITILGPGLSEEVKKKDTGGPMSRHS
jgi:hypothetical protein